MRNVVPLLLFMAAGYAAGAPLACLIEAEKEADIGVPGIGIIARMAVERGDLVSKGQVLAHLEADIERASVAVASVRAQADAEIKAATAAHELAQKKLARARQLMEVGFLSREAVEQADIEASLTHNRIQQARETEALAQRELDLSRLRLAQRSIRSPFDGVVIERYRNEGERVEREPILRIAKLAPLRVEVILPASQFGKVVPGTSVPIRTDIPGARDLTAKVVLVDRYLDAASNTFRVRLQLPNPDHRIPAGLRCNAEFNAVPAPSPPQQAPGPDSPANHVDVAGRLTYQLQSTSQNP
jgi:RND family efflux transporter MFP subunit